MHHLLSFFRAKIYILSCLGVELCTPLPLTAPFLIVGSLCSDVVCLDVPLVLSCSLPQWSAPGPPTHCLRSAQPSSSPASHHRAERPTLKTKESLMENRLVWEGQAGRGGGRRFLGSPHFCSSLKALLARVRPSSACISVICLLPWVHVRPCAWLHVGRRREQDPGGEVPRHPATSGLPPLRPLPPHFPAGGLGSSQRGPRPTHPNAHCPRAVL